MPLQVACFPAAHTLGASQAQRAPHLSVPERSTRVRASAQHHTPPPTSGVHAIDTTQSKKRGLSLEEKRDRVLEVFHESADVFVLKVRLARLCGGQRAWLLPEVVVTPVS